jgi:hypothetical protein
VVGPVDQRCAPGVQPAQHQADQHQAQQLDQGPRPPPGPHRRRTDLISENRAAHTATLANRRGNAQREAMHTKRRQKRKARKRENEKQETRRGGKILTAKGGKETRR